MGQQQLLLLVLGTVIVGLAVVVGIEAFEQNQIQANQDALINQGLTFASDVQAEYLKPEQMGGWGQKWEPSTRDLTDLGRDSVIVENVNGKFELVDSNPCSSGSAGNLFVVGGGDQDGNGTYGEVDDNLVCVGIDGTSSDDINTDIDPAGDGNSYTF